MLREEDIVNINKKFDSGRVVNKGSMNFVISNIKNTKLWTTQLAYILRGLLIDHLFEEGNKRTALAIMLTYFEANNKAYDIYKTEKVITTIILKNIDSIEKIRRLIKDVSW